jgi:hypothetical protein
MKSGFFLIGVEHIERVAVVKKFVAVVLKRICHWFWKFGILMFVLLDRFIGSDFLSFCVIFCPEKNINSSLGSQIFSVVQKIPIWGKKFN